MKAPAIIESVRLSKRYAHPPARVAKPACSEKELSRLDKIFRGLLGTGHGPGVTFVFENDETREWAREIYQRMAKLAGAEGVRATWWKISDLSVPGILAGAVSSAVRSDLIVVASHAEGLPLPFYVWVNLWWPNRPEYPGGLIALVGKSERPASRVAAKVGDYLMVVAQQAKMDFVRLEKTLQASEEAASSQATNGHSRDARNGSPVVDGLASWNGHRHD